MKSSGFPKSYRDLCRAFDTLPGIGEQGAQRLVEWLIYHGDVQAFSSNLTALQALEWCPLCNRLADAAAKGCSNCVAFGEDEKDSLRSKTVMILESEQDVARVQESGYQGRMYVLHGVLSPARGVGPDQLKVPSLLAMLEGLGESNLMMPLADSVEGRATAEYIQRKSGLQGKILTMKDLLAELQGAQG